ncbi:uncharacterized protein N7515_009255 [Penicillium bovifimosum]|uniref:Uncharacterized protein n=1 Tax=Penicillium bovifimosum TaxID=126998 RepID=A0A9W9GJ66_9EURO|nr:uncharacterized protein N7515_009255 [Penicillium bovifimosum]KAJ5121294.1 hypothetical protein N7515_009255 [Penicillium bovifimosum]
MLRLIFTTTTIITTSTAIYLYTFHARLSKRITHISHHGPLTKAPVKPSIQSLPPQLSNNDSNDFITLYDRASKCIPLSTLPSPDIPHLFTNLVRRNMTAFSRFPQALLLAMASKTSEQKRSFKKEYLATSDFEVGDLVCGVYRVVSRSADRVEFEMAMEKMEFVQGRLGISYREEGGNVVFCSETVMWKRADEGRKMPLERGVVRWLHEIASWWLIDSGVRYLVDLEG